MTLSNALLGSIRTLMPLRCRRIEPTGIFGCIAWLPKQYIEIENRRLTYEPVSTSLVLPRWFSNQQLTDSLVATGQFLFVEV